MASLSPLRCAVPVWMWPPQPPAVSLPAAAPVAVRFHALQSRAACRQDGFFALRGFPLPNFPSQPSHSIGSMLLHFSPALLMALSDSLRKPPSATFWWSDAVAARLPAINCPAPVHPGPQLLSPSLPRPSAPPSNTLAIRPFTSPPTTSPHPVHPSFPHPSPPRSCSKAACSAP